MTTTPLPAMSDAQVLDQEELTKTDEPEVAHIGRKEDVTRAYVEGTRIVALCGTEFIPTRDPSRYPVCPACREVLTRLRAGGSN